MLLFFLNIHFLIFLKIKESHETFPEITKNNSNLFDKLECAAELGTLYSKLMDYVWIYVDIFVYFFVPFITMCITFSIIKTKLKEINRNYASICLDKRFNNHIKRIYLRKIKRNNKIIYVLFGTNLYFCISILPFFIFSIFKEANAKLNVNESYYLKSLRDFLFYSNNALNIFFYGFTSKDFRRTMKRMLGLESCFSKKEKAHGKQCFWKR
jgi:hypothetical protein